MLIDDQSFPKPFNISPGDGIPHFHRKRLGQKKDKRCIREVAGEKTTYELVGMESMIPNPYIYLVSGRTGVEKKDGDKRSHVGIDIRYSVVNIIAKTEYECSTAWSENMRKC